LLALQSGVWHGARWADKVFFSVPSLFWLSSGYFFGSAPFPFSSKGSPVSRILVV